MARIKPHWKKVLVLLSTAFVVSLFLSTYTDPFLRPVIIRTFNLVKGKGFVDSPRVSIEVDEEGIPITNYPHLGSWRNPVNIAQKGIEYYKNGDFEHLHRVADWFVKNAVVRDGFVVWEYQFPWKPYNMTPPWISAMAQGLAVQVLGYAYKVTGDEKYIDLAEKALFALLIPISKGGCREDIDGGFWYEEYADVGGRNPRVLNGMVFTLEGIYNYWLITHSSKAKEIFDKGLIALRHSLSRYDACGWSYYDILKHPASDNYHKIHIKQMKWLYQITGDPIFKKYATEWEGNLHSPFRFIAQAYLRGFRPSDILVFLANFLGILSIIIGFAFLKHRFSRGGMA